MKTKFIFLFIFLWIFCSTLWGGDLEGFRLCIDQFLQDRADLEKFGYTSTDILKKRLKAFTKDLWYEPSGSYLWADRIHTSQKGSLSWFDTDWEAKSCLNFVEKQTSVVDTSDIQINDEDYPSTHHQKLPYLSMFDDRNFIAVWEDERNGDIDIFAQKMTFNGDTVGRNFEVSEEDFPKDQWLPCVATIGDTAFVVIWVDGENFNIYGRRFDADISPLGEVFQVNGTGIPSWAPSLSCGPNGGFVVVWVDVGSGNIYAKRFDPSADSLGASFKVNGDKGTRPHISPSVSVGESGNFVIVWEDFRETDSDIYAQRYNSDGNKLGNNIMISSDSLDEDQYSPCVSLGKNDRFMVSWVDLRSGTEDVFAILFSFDGTPDTSVFRVDTAITSEPREDPWVGSDTTGRYVVVWTDDASVVYTQRFDSLGQPFEFEAKLTISDAEASGERHDPTLSTNPSGAFVVGWMDKRNSNYDIYARTVRSNGSPQQGSDFTINDDSLGANQKFPKIATNSDDGFMVVWEDFRNSNYDIYLKRFDSSGQPLGDDFRVNDSLDHIDHSLPDIACDDSGNFVVVWEDARGSLDIYGQLFDHSGNFVGENFKVNADSGTNLHNSPCCDMSPSGDFVVVWAAKEENVQHVYGRLFGSDSQPKDTCFKIEDDEGEVDYPSPKVSMDSSGNFIVAWEDKREGQNRIYLQRYNFAGVKLGDNFSLHSENPSPTQSQPDLDLNKKGEFVVVWVESEKVLAQRYDSSATWIGDNITVVDNPSSFPENPKVKVTEDGYFVVAWTDHRGEGSDIYFQTYLNGSPQGPDQLVNTDTGQALQTSADVDCWGNYLYSVWMDNRNAGHGFDIYSNTVNFKETAVEDEEERKDLPEKFALYQNYPNPFNPSTKIPFTVYGSQFTVHSPIHEKAVHSSRFMVHRPVHATLKVYNILGQKVRTLVDEEKLPGIYQAIWDGKDDAEEDVASGIYFYQLKVGDQILTRKMLLLR
ncbi:MAG: hypothetical protein KAW52_04550 [candidate division Zixibacteria bacterium]|nr:hypothetical protein [candidate division Zixibacteria bacterium]